MTDRVALLLPCEQSKDSAPQMRPGVASALDGNRKQADGGVPTSAAVLDRAPSNMPAKKQAHNRARGAQRITANRATKWRAVRSQVRNLWEWSQGAC